jgi:hypothetical protein
VLLFGDARINTADLFAAGYDGWGEIDSTIQGLLAPQGDERIRAAFAAAGAAYIRSKSSELQPLDITVTFPGLAQGAEGTLCRIDSTHNNAIFRYDSLLAEGYSRNAAVAEILPDQALRSNAVLMPDSTYRIVVPPNGIVFLELIAKRGPTGMGPTVTTASSFETWPCPATDVLHVRNTHGPVAIHDLLGRLMWNGHVEGDGRIDISGFPGGAYLVFAANGTRLIVKK